MATDYKPADLNKDGEVTPKERAKYRKTKAEVAAAAGGTPTAPEPTPDKLSGAEMETRFGFAKEVVFSNTELRGLWQKAIKEQWTDAMFQSQLRGTDWYQNNADFTRKAWAAQQTGGADWTAQLQEAEGYVQARATELGSQMSPEQLKEFSRRYVFEGWGDPARKRLMDQAMAGGITSDGGFLEGTAGNLQENMMETARRNGISLSDGYFQSAAQSVARGLTTEDDWMRQIREQAASKWPSFSDKIMSGIDMEDLASGYVNTMAAVFEMNPESISLEDPFIKSALQGIDPKTGEPSMEGLWDFEYRLKSDPRWTNTKQGANDVASVGMDVLRRMGFQS